MEVLHICSIYKNDFMKYFMQSLIERNVKVNVFFPRKKGVSFETSESYVLSSELFNNVDRVLYFSKQVKCLKSIEINYEFSNISVIHAHTLYTDGYQAYKLNKKYNLPYIVAVRATDINYFYKLRKDLFFTARKILLNASKIVFLSESYKEKCVNLFNIDVSDKSVVIPNGLDPYFEKNIKEEEKRTQEKTMKILAVGYISKRKNQEMTCKAIDLLIKSGYDIKYTVVGKISDQKLFKKLKKYPFLEYKNFMGKSELLEEYRKNDIFIMPSIYETFGLSYLEAISQNIPVIYSKNEGFDKWFQDKEVGYAVDSVNTKELSDKIVKLYKKEDTFKNISNKLERFNWNHISMQYEKLYKEVVRDD